MGIYLSDFSVTVLEFQGTDFSMNFLQWKSRYFSLILSFAQAILALTSLKSTT